jgi:hypothetical protein
LVEADGVGFTFVTDGGVDASRFPNGETSARLAPNTNDKRRRLRLGGTNGWRGGLIDFGAGDALGFGDGLEGGVIVGVGKDWAGQNE